MKATNSQEEQKSQEKSSVSSGREERQPSGSKKTEVTQSLVSADARHREKSEVPPSLSPSTPNSDESSRSGTNYSSTNPEGPTTMNAVRCVGGDSAQQHFSAQKAPGQPQHSMEHAAGCSPQDTSNVTITGAPHQSQAAVMSSAVPIQPMPAQPLQPSSAGVKSNVLVVPMNEAPMTGVAPAKVSAATKQKPQPHVYHDYAHVADTVGFVRKKTGGVTKPFPEKLMELLTIEAKENPGIINWLPHGRAFIVRKPKQFTEIVMPKYFRQSKLTSFQRQLNLYGFRRITQGPDAGAYYHELFLLSRPQLCMRMNRQKVKGTGHKQPTDASSEPNFYAMPQQPHPSMQLGPYGLYPTQENSGASSLPALVGSPGLQGVHGAAALLNISQGWVGGGAQPPPLNLGVSQGAGRTDTGHDGQSTGFAAERQHPLHYEHSSYSQHHHVAGVMVSSLGKPVSNHDSRPMLHSAQDMEKSVGASCYHHAQTDSSEASNSHAKPATSQHEDVQEHSAEHMPSDRTTRDSAAHPGEAIAAITQLRGGKYHDAAETRSGSATAEQTLGQESPTGAANISSESRSKKDTELSNQGTQVLHDFTPV